MYIESIDIRGNQRFLMLPHGNLQVEFKGSVVLVEGTNGAGKSSLFNELTPLPANKEYYKSDGYKKIVIIHKGKRYELVSDFAARPQFSFVVDGEELNTAGIISAQRALVADHFGLTDNIHDILTDVEMFTRLSLGGRKKLFSMLTKLNIDHILRNYAKLNDQYNLMKLKLRTETNQLKTEESRLVNQDTIYEVKSELENLKLEVDLLLEMRQELTQWFTQGTNDGSYNDFYETLQSQRQHIKDNFLTITTSNKEYLPRVYESYLKDYNEISALLEDTYVRLGELDEARRGAEVSVGDTNNLQTSYDSLLKEIESGSERLGYFNFNPNNFHGVERAYSDIFNDVRETIVTMTTNPKDDEGVYHYNQVKLNQSRESIERINQELHKLDVADETLRANADILKNMDQDLLCPCCGEKISLTEIMKDDSIRVEKINHIREQKSKLTTQLQKDLEYVTDCMKYFEDYSSISRVIKVTQEALPAFWDEVKQREILTSNPNGLTNMITVLTQEVQLGRDLMKLHEEGLRIKQDLDVSLSIDRVKAEQAVSEFTALELRAKNLQVEREVLQKHLEHTRDSIKTHELLEESIRKVSFTKGVVQEHNLSTRVSQLQNVIVDEVRALRLRMSELETIVQNHGMVEHTINAYRQNIAETESEMKVLEAFLKELSPKDGIIAQTISSFLNTIITNINRTIESIWSYPMKLSTLDVGNESLNYRFKLEVGEEGRIVRDVERASAGQQEVINLSFKLVMYKLLGFEQYGIFLDELSKSLTEQHTDNMNRLVQTFIHESDFSQVFIISHKENMEFLRDCQVVDLGWGA